MNMRYYCVATRGVAEQRLHRPTLELVQCLLDAAVNCCNSENALNIVIRALKIGESTEFTSRGQTVDFEMRIGKLEEKSCEQ